MKKLMILFAAVCGCMMAQAQTIDAIKVTQGETTDWYPFGESSRIDVAITNGNPMIEGNIYDLTKGNVETAFGTDPLPAIRGAAIEEVEQVAATAKEEIDELGVYYTVKDQAKNEIDKAVAAAEASITNADSEEQVNDAKNNALNEINKQLANVEEYYKLLQAAIAEIKYAANDAKEEIDRLGVDDNAKNDAKDQIDNIVSTAKATINEATNKDMINKAKTQAIADIHNEVQYLKDMWIPVRYNQTVDNYGTLCWKYNLTDIDGAELYAIAGIENGSIILKEVLANETQAGASYVIRATEKSIHVKNGNQCTGTPLAAVKCNGLQGTFKDIVEYTAGDPENKLEGNYIIYQNEWRKCGVYTGLRAYSAYLIMNYVPGTAPAPASGRKYISMPLPKETPTELESVDGSQRTIRNGKFLRNGQLIIVKDNKMYNVQGMKL